MAPSCRILTLSATFSFSSPAAVFFGGDVSTSWTLSFKLTPARSWVRAWMNGGNANQITANKETR